MGRAKRRTRSSEDGRSHDHRPPDQQAVSFLHPKFWPRPLSAFAQSDSYRTPRGEEHVLAGKAASRAAGPAERSATASVESREGGRHPGPTFDCCVSRPAILLYAARHGRIVVRRAAPGRTIVHGDVKTMFIARAGL